MLNSGMGGILPVMNVDGGRDGNGWGGDGGWWVLVILFALFGGWGGNGFGAGNGGALTRGELCQDMNFADNANAVRGISTDLNAGFRTIDNAICSLGYNNAQLANGIQMQIGSEFRGLDNAICTLGYNTQAGFNALASQQAQCCCEMKQGFAEVQRTISDEFCSLKMEQKDAQIAAMQNQLNMANLAASQEAQTRELTNTLRPCPTPAYVTCNPWATNGTSFNGCNGFGSCGCAA